MTTGNSLINLGDLSQPVTILIEKISNAIGVAYEPTKIRRNAKAEADANRIMVLSGLDLQSEVANRGIQRFITQQTRKQINIENIIQQSIEELPDNAEVEQLDEDWLANFFDKCENVSNETMQLMWAKLLTSEATKSGTISKKTINLVANIDKEDAENFTIFCQFVWNLGTPTPKPTPLIFDINEDPILREQGISFTTLNHLHSIGLITLNLSNDYRMHIPSKEEIYSYFDKIIKFEFDKQEAYQLPLGACLLTVAGVELFNICKPQLNIKYLNSIVDYLKDKGISVTDIT